MTVFPFSDIFFSPAQAVCVLVSGEHLSYSFRGVLEAALEPGVISKLVHVHREQVSARVRYSRRYRDPLAKRDNPKTMCRCH